MADGDSASRSVPVEREPIAGPAASRQAADETLDRRVIAELRDAGASSGSDFVIVLIDGFIVEAEEQAALVRDACQRQDANALKGAAHSLKGSAATMGARRLGALCSQMEAHAAGDLDRSVTSALLIDIDEELAKVRNALEGERQDTSQQ